MESGGIVPRRQTFLSATLARGSRRMRAPSFMQLQTRAYSFRGIVAFPGTPLPCPGKAGRSAQLPRASIIPNRHMCPTAICILGEKTGWGLREREMAAALGYWDG